jgi:xanthine dehydrogenase accessory factor
LREVAASDAAYVGMIGSVRRVSAVLTHLAREGVPRDALERVHTPIGLDINAETPEEIAVAIVAELVLVRRGGTGRKLSELRRARIGVGHRGAPEIGVRHVGIIRLRPMA